MCEQSNASAERRATDRYRPGLLRARNVMEWRDESTTNQPLLLYMLVSCVRQKYKENVKVLLFLHRNI